MDGLAKIYFGKRIDGNCIGHFTVITGKSKEWSSRRGAKKFPFTKYFGNFYLKSLGV
jgi:hypothetical protein